MPPHSSRQLLILLLSAIIPPATSQPTTPTPKTTVTTTCTTSSTTHNSLLDLGYPGYDTLTRIATATTTIVEAPLVTQTTGPATVLATHMVAGTDTTYLVRSTTSTSTRCSSWRYTTTRTWIVHPFSQSGSSPTPLPQQQQPPPSPQQQQQPQPAPIPVCPETSCANPEEEAEKIHEQRAAADPRCAARGMETGCQAQQCQARRAGDDDDDGRYHWWCLRISQTDFIFPDLRMGRSCWSAADNSFMQLNAPCLAVDYQAGCRPCRGRDLGWNGANWIEASL